MYCAAIEPPSECPPTLHDAISGWSSMTAEAASMPKTARLNGTGTIATRWPASAISRAAGAYAAGGTLPPGYRIRPVVGSMPVGV